MRGAGWGQAEESEELSLPNRLLCHVLHAVQAFISNTVSSTFPRCEQGFCCCGTNHSADFTAATMSHAVDGLGLEPSEL